MKISISILSLFLVTLVTALPSLDILSRDSESERGKCPPFHGNFTIEQYQLYPENVDFSFHTCLLYISAVWNATLVVYDPYASKILEIVEFPGISHTETYHLSGINVDKRTGLVSLVVDFWNTILTGGVDQSGANFIMQWDPVSHQLDYKINLTDTTHSKYGGFGDVEQDPESNVYVVGTFPSSIVKVSRDGKTVAPWYVIDPIIPTTAGFAGMATNGWTLLVNDGDKLSRFDMRADKGVPIPVPHSPDVNWTFTDAIFLPPRYHGRVLLLAEDLVGIIVLRSRDEWRTAEFMGKVVNSVPNSETVASVQIGNSVYLVPMDVGDINHPNTRVGNQSHFPFVDITREVDGLLKA